MGKVILDVAMSLDGFIAGPSDQPERLHDWMFPPSGNVDATSAKVIEDGIQRYGAIVMGRGAYDLGDAYDGYVENPYQVVHFVLTHEPPAKPAKGDTQFVFVSDGLRLFDTLGDTPVELEIMQVIEARGVTHLRYRAAK